MSPSNESQQDDKSKENQKMKEERISVDEAEKPYLTKEENIQKLSPSMEISKKAEEPIEEELTYGKVSKPRSESHDSNVIKIMKKMSSRIAPKNFALRLVLLSSLASFLFGFNVAVLNTALATISQEFLLCGPLPAEAVVALKNSSCSTNPTCSDVCIKPGDPATEFSCKGGYTYNKCPKLQWMLAVVSTSVLLGGALGAIFGGKMIHQGRRLLLLYNLVIFAFGIITCVCANSYSALLWGRLVVGFGVGIVSVVSPTFISEVTPANKRGLYGVFHQIAVTVGIFIASVLGIPFAEPSAHTNDPLWSIPTFDRVWWRVMMGLGLVPVIITMYMFCFVYKFETPIWYIEQHKYDEAASVLRRIHQTNKIEEELQTAIDNNKISEEAKKKRFTLYQSLKQPGYRMAILVGVGLAAFQQLGGINVFVTSSNEIFRKSGLNRTLQNVMTSVVFLLNVLMTFPTMYLIEKVGRKSLLLVGSAMQFILLLPAAISLWFEKDVNTTSGTSQVLSIVAVFGFVIFFALAYGPVVWVYLFEIYPIEIKDSGSSFATAMNWTAGIVMVFLALVLSNKVAFTLFAVMQLLSTIFIAVFMRETKGRRLGDSPYINSSQQFKSPNV